MILVTSERKTRRQTIIDYNETDNSTELKKKRKKHMWFCKKCPEVFKTIKMLRTHRKTHRRNDNDAEFNYKYDERKKVYCCCSCDIETQEKEEIEKHVLILHQETFTCKTCKQSFMNPYEYSIHLNNHDSSDGYRCPFCEYAASIRSLIKRHIDTNHLNKFLYTCKLCGKGFNELVIYKEHHNIHEGIKPFQCVVCNKDFSFSSYLTTHQIRNHTVTIDGIIGTNQCHICYKRFTRKSTLGKHLKLHENAKVEKLPQKKHLCDVCGKEFGSKEKLTIHYRVHTGDKPYTCSYCAKSFTKKDYLIMHERVHSGEKPYSCDYCGKRFNQGAPLRLHIRNHTGERPYICHLCNNGFISRGVLNLHLKNCTGVKTESH